MASVSSVVVASFSTYRRSAGHEGLSVRQSLATDPTRSPTGYLWPLGAVVLLYAIELLLRVQRLHNKNLSVGHVHDVLYLGAIIAIGLLEAVALLALRTSLPPRPRAFFPWAIAAFVIMVALSLLSPDTEVIGSPDAYAYVGYAKLPAFSQAYAPPKYPFTGPGFEAIYKSWGNPIVPADYGPLWLFFDRLTLSRAASMQQALLVMRTLNIAFLILLLVALRRLLLPNPVLVLVALNPMILYYYIVEAHNDIGAILLVVVGMVIARKQPWLGAIVAGAAGLTKVTFAFIASAALGRRNLPVALAQSAIVVAVTVFGSALFGGPNYVHVMIGTGRWMVYGGGHGISMGASDAVYITGLVLHACVALIAIAALIASQCGRFIAPAAYSFSGIAPTLYPHYLGWCIPYALRTPKAAATFFATLPAIAPLIVYPAGPWGVLADLYFLAIIALFARHLLRTKSGLASLRRKLKADAQGS